MYDCLGLDVDLPSLFAAVAPLAHAYGIDPTDFEDVLQDAALASLVSIATVHNLRAWFVRCVENGCRGFLRRQRRRARFEVESELARSSPAPDAADSQLSRLELESLLDRLPPRQRRLAQLVELEGFTGTEAAAVLGYSQNSVKTLLRRTRMRLAQLAARADSEDSAAPSRPKP